MSELIQEMRELLRGAYDLHIHTSPDLLPRKINDLEMARRAEACGMAGFAIKSHYFCTAQRAWLVSQQCPACDVVGSFTINAASGGISPAAVEMAAQAGARILWFPTCDAEWEQQYALKNRDDAKKPFWTNIVRKLKEDGISLEPIHLLENGTLKDSVYDVLDVVARHNLVLATGHISKEETFALVRAARERKVARIVITHVSFPSTYYTIEEQKELARMGARMEQCYTTYATGKVDFEIMLKQIRALGPDQVILSTDLGQQTRPFPDEGLLSFFTDLYKNHVPAEDIRKMSGRNCRELVQTD